MEYQFKPMRQIAKLIGYCFISVLFFIVGDYLNPNLDFGSKFALGALIVTFSMLIVASLIFYVFKPVKI